MAQLRVALAGLGKMGISHLSMVRALAGVEVVGICDTTAYLLGVIGKYTGLATFSDFPAMLDETKPDAVIIATPTKYHAPMVRQAIERGIAVFCEKPFCLAADESQELVELAESHGVVTQVGYHNRFVGAFGEVKRLLDLGAIGTVTHGLAEAYGPVVLAPQGGTWRSQSSEGGGALYDYAAHPINLINWYLGTPLGVGGTALNSVFSREIDDEVSSTMYYPEGATVQLSVNWSDESVRKMTTRISLWGTGGKIFADRQEVQVYLREGSPLPAGYTSGWNTRYTTDLTRPVPFYLRGEEYTAQLEHFVGNVAGGRTDGENSFATAVATDRCIDLMIADARRGPSMTWGDEPVATAPVKKSRLRALVSRG